MLHRGGFAALWALKAALLAERAAPQTSGAAAHIPWSGLFKYRSIWGLMIGMFCLNFAIYFFLTWFPSYLQEARGFSLARLGTLGMVPGVMGVAGSWGGGYLSDWLLARGWSRTAARGDVTPTVAVPRAPCSFVL